MAYVNIGMKIKAAFDGPVLLREAMSTADAQLKIQDSANYIIDSTIAEVELNTLIEDLNNSAKNYKINDTLQFNSFKKIVGEDIYNGMLPSERVRYFSAYISAKKDAKLNNTNKSLSDFNSYFLNEMHKDQVARLSKESSSWPAIADNNLNKLEGKFKSAAAYSILRTNQARVEAYLALRSLRTENKIYKDKISKKFNDDLALADYPEARMMSKQIIEDMPPGDAKEDLQGFRRRMNRSPNMTLGMAARVDGYKIVRRLAAGETLADINTGYEPNEEVKKWRDAGFTDEEIEKGTKSIDGVVGWENYFDGKTDAVQNNTVEGVEGIAAWERYIMKNIHGADSKMVQDTVRPEIRNLTAWNKFHKNDINKIIEGTQGIPGVVVREDTDTPEKRQAIQEGTDVEPNTPIPNYVAMREAGLTPQDIQDGLDALPEYGKMLAAGLTPEQIQKGKLVIPHYVKMRNVGLSPQQIQKGKLPIKDYVKKREIFNDAKGLKLLQDGGNKIPGLSARFKSGQTVDQMIKGVKALPTPPTLEDRVQRMNYKIHLTELKNSLQKVTGNENTKIYNEVYNMQRIIEVAHRRNITARRAKLSYDDRIQGCKTAKQLIDCSKEPPIVPGNMRKPDDVTQVLDLNLTLINIAESAPKSLQKDASNIALAIAKRNMDKAVEKHRDNSYKWINAKSMNWFSKPTQAQIDERNTFRYNNLQAKYVTYIADRIHRDSSAYLISSKLTANQKMARYDACTKLANGNWRQINTKDDALKTFKADLDKAKLSMARLELKHKLLAKRELLTPDMRAVMHELDHYIKGKSNIPIEKRIELIDAAKNYIDKAGTTEMVQEKSNVTAALDSAMQDRGGWGMLHRVERTVGMGGASLKERLINISDNESEMSVKASKQARQNKGLSEMPDSTQYLEPKYDKPWGSR